MVLAAVDSFLSHDNRVGIILDLSKLCGYWLAEIQYQTTTQSFQCVL